MKPLLMAAGILASVVGMSRQDISPQDIAAAVAQGRDGEALEKKCKANGPNGFDIVVEGPVGRIMRAAREAKKEDREFTAADVTPALSGSVLTVAVRRDATLNRAGFALPLPSVPIVSVTPEGVPDSRAQEWLTMGGAYRASVAVRSKRPGPDGRVHLTPISTIVTPGGARTAWNGVTRTPLSPPDADMAASFDLAAFRAMPQGDVEIVAFMTDAGERSCKISDKDRAAIR
jgi:hypothetical protein